ncbi:hypothetical protein KKD52_18700 [Myxococcota bacterium]|nr:hypothetical protein [Myxococcota bacterium]MBU1413049.1 hypothetical protein [Myxococcota bacterium]MBU1512387.1 hypothetical protein [Myxococcota bacterium]
MKHIESSYRDDRGKLVGFKYSINSVLRLHLFFRMPWLLSKHAAMPERCD